MLLPALAGLIFYFIALDVGGWFAGQLPTRLGGILWVLTPGIAVLVLWLVGRWQFIWVRPESKTAWAPSLLAGALLTLFSFSSFTLWTRLGLPLTPSVGHSPHWASLLVSGVSAPIAEECLFRSRLLELFQRRTSTRVAIWGSAVLFAVSHGKWEILLPALLAGLVLALVYFRVGLLSTIVLHISHNLLLLVPWPKPRWETLLLLMGVALGGLGFIYKNWVSPSPLTKGKSLTYGRGGRD